MAVYYHSPWLPWEPDEEEERRLKKLLIWIVIPALVLGLLLKVLPVPHIINDEAKKVPPRFAKLLVETRPVPPPPVKKKEPPKPEEPKVEKPKVEKPKETPKPVPKKEKPKVETPPKVSAREKAKKSGLFAAADDFSDLRGNTSVDKLASNKPLSTGGVKAAQTNERSVITSGVGKGSGGINTSGMSRNTGGEQLAGRSTSRVKDAIGTDGRAAKGSGSKGGKSHQGGRSDEEIALVLDRNKSKMYSYYRKALRSDPTLKGKVVIRFTISPAGDVTQVSVVSSELNDADLERKLKSLFKRFKFSAKNVGPYTATYPIEFFPS